MQPEKPLSQEESNVARHYSETAFEAEQVRLPDRSLRSLTESVLAAALTKMNVRSTLDCVRLAAAFFSLLG